MVVLIGLVSSFVILRTTKVKTINKKLYSEIKLESETEDMLFNTYDEYKNKIDDNTLKEEDFENNKYALVSISYNSCGEIIEGIREINITNDSIEVTINVKRRCGVCALEYKYYLVKLDKNEVVNNNYTIDKKYKYINTVQCNSDVAYKPIIYLYPTEEKNVKVMLSNSQNITYSYPKYNNYWDVTAYPNGDLIDNKTGNRLYSLYWEGKNLDTKIKEDGFVIEGEKTIEFLEEKLDILGLNYKEKEEFIIYWLPKLENNKYNYIRFLIEEEINNYMPISIEPNPDTIIRVYMSYKPLNSKINVKNQKLNQIEREGFTVVEWGGTLID